MKKLLTTLGLIGMLSGSPKAQAGITPEIEETKQDLIEAVTTEQATPEEDGKTISFEDAEVLGENQELIEEMMNNEKMQEIINEYGEEQVRQALEELVSSEKTEAVIKYLLSDQSVQRAIEEGDGDALAQKMLHIMRFYYGVNILGKLSILILSVMFLAYSIRNLKGWRYVICKRK